MPNYARPRAFVATAITAALLSACGGSGSDDTPESKDSTDCFNEGLYHAGTEVRLEATQVGNFGMSGTYSVSTGSDPADPPLIKINSGYMFHWDYFSITPEAVYEEKVSERYATRHFVPAIRHPITMQPGQVVEQNAIQITTDQLVPSNPVNYTSGTIQFSKTYVGREYLETALGKWETCKFIVKHRVTSASTPSTFTERTDTQWVPASGPYRGFPIKSIITNATSDTAATTTQSEVTKFTLFDIK